MKAPEFLKVRFKQLHAWAKNPRTVTKKDAENLAKKIKEKGIIRNFVTWRDKKDLKDDSYTVGGGNIRYHALKDIIKINPESEVWISLNYPENEKEMIELSLLDNMPAGTYVEQALAELLYPYRSEIDLSTFKIPFTDGTDLQKFLEGFGPTSVDDIELEDESDRKTISVVCSDDDELLEMRGLLGIEEQKTNSIKAVELRKLLKKRG
jgi:hypothetical protein